MSSPGEQLASIQTLPTQRAPSATQATAKTSRPSSIESQAMADAESVNGSALIPTAPQAQTTDAEFGAQQPARNIAAATNSIFASGRPSNGPQGQAVNAMQGSIYAANDSQPSRDLGAIPLPDAQKAGEAQDLALAGMDVPDDVIAAADASAPDPSAPAVPSYQTALAETQEQPAAKPMERTKRIRSLADFFRSSAESSETASFDRNRFGQKRRLNTASIPNMAVASAGGDMLPGVNAMMPSASRPADDMSEDDQPAGLMKLASLSGMARMGANGIWTQTNEVQVSCLRPQLVGMLKAVQAHYDRPVIVTSGFRDPRHNRMAGGARHSLHTLCAAADIQVEGVDKWELADFLRSLPGRGGVGTYCHTQSVHLDIGSQRDWNWRCRRTARTG